MECLCGLLEGGHESVCEIGGQGEARLMRVLAGCVGSSMVCSR